MPDRTVSEADWAGACCFVRLDPEDDMTVSQLVYTAYQEGMERAVKIATEVLEASGKREKCRN